MHNSKKQDILWQPLLLRNNSIHIVEKNHSDFLQSCIVIKWLNMKKIIIEEYTYYKFSPYEVNLCSRAQCVWFTDQPSNSLNLQPFGHQPRSLTSSLIQRRTTRQACHPALTWCVLKETSAVIFPSEKPVVTCSTGQQVCPPLSILNTLSEESWLLTDRYRLRQELSSRGWKHLRSAYIACHVLFVLCHLIAFATSVDV